MIASVFHNKATCVEVLQGVERLRPSWWTPSCTQFLRRVEKLPPMGSTTTVPLNSSPKEKKVLIVLEGLDGVGKSLVSQTLVRKLGGDRAQLMRTPDPAYNDIRELFRVQDEKTARAFYSAANYLAAWDAFHPTDQRQFIVFDRWWCSTCAMALANTYNLASLPPAGDVVYQWPQDLPKPDVGVFLYVEEHIRQARIRRRAPEDAEERRLREQQEMRAVAMEAYRRFGLLTYVHVSTYRSAVNDILAILRKRGVQHNAVPFTNTELAETHPF
ncbi:Thymidylate kinase-like domain [Trypanosoma melophagium]|uniref:Thymidylate kinase-like domain n=1 Tax=Trypanosoma melophagium TaxID=715481 RepID=UPI00351A88AE|nr:Thymidylate kinase-like domain [Trypanosoma melophagium]